MSAPRTPDHENVRIYLCIFCCKCKNETLYPASPLPFPLSRKQGNQTKLTMTRACLSLRERSPALSLPYFGHLKAKMTTAFKPSPRSSFTFYPLQASIPYYVMQTSKLPASICCDIDRSSLHFIWGDVQDQKRIHLVNWDSVCRPKDGGGLGLKKAAHMNNLLLCLP